MRLWQSRGTTFVFVVLFAAVVARGVWLGAAERADIDAEVRVCLHFESTTTRDVSLTGRAIFSTVVDSDRRAAMLGPCRLDVRAADLEHAVLRIVLSWQGARPGDSMRLVDEASGEVHVLHGLVANRCVLTLPLPRTPTTLRFEPSQERLGVRVHELTLRADAGATFAREDQWVEVHRDDNGRTAIGSGFWRDAADARLPTLQCAWLRIEPTAPGPHRLQLTFLRADPTIGMPIVALDGRRLWSVGEGTAVWGRATTVDGVTEVELEVDLQTSNVVSVEAPGPVASARERGVGRDASRVAYWLFVSRCRVVPK
ncbi:MAG: hypothetical protein JNM25_06485 [Planctomycetes bacterium]|nr:hypothetical protein [Planctomycetota bacterium]